ncbi:MAG: NrfD/PsrC family molybdoenzyme membrane anchor subunit, partial [Alphaproteobacteria bacterium]
EPGEGSAPEKSSPGRSPSLAPTPGSRPGQPLLRGAGEGHLRPAADIPTYYDQPALKPSPYGWEISGYIFIGGLGGSAQILAAAADIVDGERFGDVVRNGRYLALASAAVGVSLLLLDLRTPRRFYNMLRIFRPTSPMSIGSYVLVGFGGLGALLAGTQLAQDLGARSAAVATAAKLLDVPAALLGAAMSTYTGALLGATSTPLWAAAPLALPATFGVASMSSAAAALSLTGAGAAAPAVDRLERFAAIAELVLLHLLHRQIQHSGVRTRIGLLPVALLSAVPLLKAAPPHHRVKSEPSREARSPWAPVAVLTGSWLLRHLVLQAGNRSARRPRDYFRFAGRR